MMRSKRRGEQRLVKISRRRPPLRLCSGPPLPSFVLLRVHFDFPRFPPLNAAQRRGSTEHTHTAQRRAHRSGSERRRCKGPSGWCGGVALF